MKKKIRVDGGEFIFDTIDEGGRKLKFNPSLKINWCAYKSCDRDGEIITVYADYDFGMTDEFRPYESIYESIFRGWGYNGITKETPLSEIVKSFVYYDLFHAFYHYDQDPNYSHLHWALWGCLQSRVTVIDADEYPTTS